MSAGLILLHAWWGLNEDVKGRAERLRTEGLHRSHSRPLRRPGREDHRRGEQTEQLIREGRSGPHDERRRSRDRLGAPGTADERVARAAKAKGRISN